MTLALEIFIIWTALSAPLAIATGRFINFGMGS